MKGLFKEFKEFAVKGNMMDMAIGIIIQCRCKYVGKRGDYTSAHPFVDQGN